MHQEQFLKKATQDAKSIMCFIESHELKEDIIDLYTEGPDPQSGFLFTPMSYWKVPQAFEVMRHKIIGMGYDSRGFAFMNRKVESLVKSR
tara:strand:- start:7100 stop:7369 length:270 start_codon:yes stop_codon:yes gene_type:complete